MVDRPNLFIKIPAARQGLPAIASCLAEGISINVTLIFSLQRYDAVMDAFLGGMERARKAGRDLSIGSVASFFVSRVDTEIDARLTRSAPPRRRPYADARRSRTRGWPISTMSRCSPRTSGPRCKPPGPGPSGLSWASTSVKDPAYPDTRYVVELVAPGVVNTMPEATLRLVADHCQGARRRVHGHYEESQQVFDQLRGLGIDYDDVVQKLEDGGVAAFDGAGQRLGGQLATTLRAEPARQ